MPGEPRRQHRLPSAGRAQQKDVMATRPCGKHRVDGVFVADDVCEIRRLDRNLGLHRCQINWLDRLRFELGAVPDRSIPQ